MSSITYKELSDKWKEQREQYDKWRVALVREAHSLRNEIASILGGPETWVTYDDLQERRYVEVIDLSTAEKRPAASFSSDAITDNGELFFGISFTFDMQPHAYPKSLYHIAMAVRYMGGNPEYCQWDTDMNTPMAGQSWQRNKLEFIEGIFTILDAHFSFDPLQGIPRNPGIGFVQS